MRIVQLKLIKPKKNSETFRLVDEKHDKHKGILTSHPR